MSHEHTETPDEICARIPVLCRAIDSVEQRSGYKEKEKDIEELTEMLCNEAFDCSLYSLTMKKISTYLVGRKWSKYRFTVDRSGFDVRLVLKRT
jgi:hypothetical protein